MFFFGYVGQTILLGFWVCPELKKKKKGEVHLTITFVQKIDN